MPKNLWQVPQQLPLRSDARGMERGEVPQTWKIQFQQEGERSLVVHCQSVCHTGRISVKTTAE
jgi:hypothetical protein